MGRIVPSDRESMTIFDLMLPGCRVRTVRGWRGRRAIIATLRQNMMVSRVLNMWTTIAGYRFDLKIIFRVEGIIPMRSYSKLFASAVIAVSAIASVSASLAADLAPRYKAPPVAAP